ncbi:MAG: uncharacterized protein A8A55_0840 [Amphiamblys sp. WSBS2006]|nr:MAG: uncharacterized protein A8A55_0840 [Amphiamblys sp. WSBS2006]
MDCSANVSENKADVLRTKRHIFATYGDGMLVSSHRTEHYQIKRYEEGLYLLWAIKSFKQRERDGACENCKIEISNLDSFVFLDSTQTTFICGECASAPKVSVPGNEDTKPDHLKGEEEILKEILEYKNNTVIEQRTLTIGPEYKEGFYVLKKNAVIVLKNTSISDRGLFFFLKNNKIQIDTNVVLFSSKGNPNAPILGERFIENGWDYREFLVVFGRDEAITAMGKVSGTPIGIHIEDIDLRGIGTNYFPLLLGKEKETRSKKTINGLLFSFKKQTLFEKYNKNVSLKLRATGGCVKRVRLSNREETRHTRLKSLQRSRHENAEPCFEEGEVDGYYDLIHETRQRTDTNERQTGAMLVLLKKLPENSIFLGILADIELHDEYVFVFPKLTTTYGAHACRLKMDIDKYETMTSIIKKWHKDETKFNTAAERIKTLCLVEYGVGLFPTMYRPETNTVDSLKLEINRESTWGALQEDGLQEGGLLKRWAPRLWGPEKVLRKKVSSWDISFSSGIIKMNTIELKNYAIFFLKTMERKNYKNLNTFSLVIDNKDCCIKTRREIWNKKNLIDIPSLGINLERLSLSGYAVEFLSKMTINSQHKKIKELVLEINTDEEKNLVGTYFSMGILEYMKRLSPDTIVLKRKALFLLNGISEERLSMLREIKIREPEEQELDKTIKRILEKTTLNVIVENNEATWQEIHLFYTPR